MVPDASEKQEQICGCNLCANTRGFNAILTPGSTWPNSAEHIAALPVKAAQPEIRRPTRLVPRLQ